MFWIMTLLWMATLLAPLAMLIAFLPAGRACPRCACEDTLPIRWTPLRPVRRWLTRRWCSYCGWEGVARSGLAARPAPELESVPDAGEDEAPWRGI